MTDTYFIVNAKLPAKLVREFRGIIFEQRGLMKGDFKDCLIEAIELWIIRNRIEGKRK